MFSFRKKVPSGDQPSQHFDALHHDTPPKPKGGLLNIMNVVNKVPILGELSQIGPLIPKVIDIFSDKSGRMSSKRMGAGGLTIAGITMVQTGAATHDRYQFFGGIALCGMALVLWYLTRFEPGANDSGSSNTP